MLEDVFNYVSDVFILTGTHLVLFFLPPLLLAWIMNATAAAAEKRSVQVFGIKAHTWLFSLTGTVVHECSHALCCLVFGHRITEMRLFENDPDTGTAGYVNHSYNPKNPYQVAGNFFIGLAPVFIGATLIYAASVMLLDFPLPDFKAGEGAVDGARLFSQMLKILRVSLKDMLDKLFLMKNLKDWRFYLFLYLAFSVGSGVTLSSEDIKGAAKGLACILVLLLLFNMATYWKDDLFSRFAIACGGVMGAFYAVIILALAMNAVFSLAMEAVIRLAFENRK